MVQLSKHTTDEMERRGILLSYLEAALTSPDRVAHVTRMLYVTFQTIRARSGALPPAAVVPRRDGSTGHGGRSDEFLRLTLG
jgi:hypothetical protein